MEPHVAKDSFCTYTGQSEQPNATIFFISGNPGLIGYYHPFLSLLSQNLGDEARHTDIDDSSQGSSFQIYGCSLAGFEVDSSGNKGSGKKLFDVEDQIRFVHEKLESVVAQNAARGAHGKQRVILMGHSVGAYIAMEVLRRHREDVADISPGAYDITGAVMLFPTVKDIAHSPSGQKLTVWHWNIALSIVNLTNNPPPSCRCYYLSFQSLLSLLVYLLDCLLYSYQPPC